MAVMARVVAWDRLKHMHDVPTADEVSKIDKNETTGKDMMVDDVEATGMRGSR